MKTFFARAGIIAMLVVASPLSAADRKAELSGQWKEYWGAPGVATDVTYHDEYRVSVEPNGQASVEAVDRNDQIRDVEIRANGIIFTDHTTFDVRYALTLNADGTELMGTAITPNEVVFIRWERVK